MRTSDNLLKTISYYFEILTPTQFIIKTDIILFKNHEMILKSIEIADMINKLTKTAETEAEKKFYKQKIKVEKFNTELAKERKINPGPTTIKELVIGNGIVYSSCLNYFYDALTKYEPPEINLPLLAESIGVTHRKLTKLLNDRGGSVTQVTIDEIQKELTSLNSTTTDLYKNIKDVNTNIKDTKKSMSNIKETLDNTILKLQMDALNKQDITDIKDNLNTLYQEMNETINSKIQYALEDQVETLKKSITETITEQIKNTSIQALQLHLKQTLEKEIGSLLSIIKTNLEEDFSNARTSTTTNREVNSISRTIKNLTKKADNLAEDKNLAELVKDIKKLETALNGIETNNQDKTNAMGMSIVNISKSINTPIEYDEEEYDEEEHQNQYTGYDDYDDYEGYDGTED